MLFRSTGLNSTILNYKKKLQETGIVLDSKKHNICNENEYYNSDNYSQQQFNEDDYTNIIDSYTNDNYTNDNYTNDNYTNDNYTKDDKSIDLYFPENVLNTIENTKRYEIIDFYSRLNKENLDNNSDIEDRFYNQKYLSIYSDFQK